jgi:predicted transcriptional regulator
VPEAARDPLLDLLPGTIDELAASTGRSVRDLAAALSGFELAGLVAEGEGVFRRLAPG